MNPLHIFSSFDHSTYLEMALAMLEEKGVDRENILAVPIERRKPNRRLFDTIHSSDGVSLFDSGMVLATAFSVIGASYGFVLAWGPIVWGMIGALSGIGLGIGVSLFSYWRKHGKEHRFSEQATEVVVIVNCQAEQAKMVEETLWDYLAYGVGRLQSKQTELNQKET